MERGISFRDSQWKLRSVLIGISVLLLWRSTEYLSQSWYAKIPWWLLVILLGIAPQMFLLTFPAITRFPRGWPAFRSITASRLLKEFCFAIPIAIGIHLVLSLANQIVERLMPGKSLVPDSITRLASSKGPTSLYLWLVFSFTFAPIAEEVFFRGFLQNALKARMRAIFACLLQCGLFGIGHFMGITHSGIAVLIGLALTAIYEWRKTLLTPILVHATYNLIAGLGIIGMIYLHAHGSVLGIVCDPKSTACVIQEITPDSAAEKAGLQIGDRILSLNGETVVDVQHLGKIVLKHLPGSTISLRIERNGKTVDMKATLQKRK